MKAFAVDAAVLAQAKDIIAQGAPCVFLEEGRIAAPGQGKGVQPLLTALREQPEQLKKQAVIDKIVGKAAAMLCVLGKVQGVYAMTISRSGAEYLAAYGVPFSYEKMVEYIENRTGDGMCPMEAAVQTLSDPEEGAAALRETLARLRGLASKT